jgi:hypothetical protein
MSKVLLTYAQNAKGNLSRERLQLRPGDLGLADIKCDDRGVDELD